MLLARLQIDRSELQPAIDTLERSMAAGSDQSDYQAFIAALKQRAGRHKEAVNHYVAALKKAPNKGIWWMGMGISLQGDSRTVEARDAYIKAKMSGELPSELVAFVDQRIAQLSR
jgi:MSHA biogenesis protein MshN